MQHKEQDSGRFAELSLVEQLANVGSEVERTIRWKQKGNKEYSQMAFERALELIDLSLADKKNSSHSRLREIGRVREGLVDYFMEQNSYGSSDKGWQKYFYAFTFAARLQSGR